MADRSASPCFGCGTPFQAQALFTGTRNGGFEESSLSTCMNAERAGSGTCRQCAVRALQLSKLCVRARRT